MTAPCSFRVALLALCLAAVPASAQAGPQAWLLPGIEKVRDDARPRASARLAAVAARGEVRGFQVALRLPDAARVTVRIGAADGPGTLGRPVVYHQATVDVRRPSEGRPPAYAGSWPDVLRRHAGAITLPAGTHAFWIDIPIPADAAAGTYRIPVTVRAGGRVRTLRARVEVVAAAPERRLRTHTSLRWGSFPPVSAIKTLARFRFRPSEWTDRESGLRQLLPHQDVFSLPGESNPAANRSQLRRAMARLRALGADRRGVAYVADEPACNDLAAVEQKAAAAIAADGAIRPLVTIGPRACDGAAGAVLRSARIFVPTERDARPFSRDGSEQWIYPNNGAAGPGYVTLAIDDPGSRQVLIGWRAAALGATGVLYWNTEIWSRGSDPRREPWNAGVGQQYNGDGVLLYPDGSPSLRLALFREGAADYDLAACAGPGAASILRRIAPSSRDIESSPARILTARRDLLLACATR